MHGVVHLPAVDDGRSGFHVPAVRINLLYQKVEEVAHLNLTVAEEGSIVFPELDMVLCYLPCLVSVFEFEFTNLELLLIGNHIPQLCRFTLFRRSRRIVQALLFLVDDIPERIFVYARHKNTAPVTENKLFWIANIGPVFRTFNHPFFDALGEVEDPSGFGLPYLWPVCFVEPQNKRRQHAEEIKCIRKQQRVRCDAIAKYTRTNTSYTCTFVLHVVWKRKRHGIGGKGGGGAAAGTP